MLTLEAKRVMFPCADHEVKHLSLFLWRAENVGQGAVIAIGLVLIMGIAGNDIQQGKLSVGICSG